MKSESKLRYWIRRKDHISPILTEFISIYWIYSELSNLFAARLGSLFFIGPGNCYYYKYDDDYYYYYFFLNTFIAAKQQYMNLCVTIVWHLHIRKHSLLLILSSFCTFLSGIYHITDHRVYICMSLMVRGIIGCWKWHGGIHALQVLSATVAFHVKKGSDVMFRRYQEAISRTITCTVTRDNCGDWLVMDDFGIITVITA